MKILIRFATYQVEAELFDTPTGRAVYESLPLKRNVAKWGKEIYFEIPVEAPLEKDARAEVSVGDLAFWPNIPAFCIFFGETPVSTDGQPKAASAVNVFGRLIQADPDRLQKIPEGENVFVERTG